MDDSFARLDEQLKQVTKNLESLSHFQEKSFEKLDSNSVLIIEAKHERMAILEKMKKMDDLKKELDNLYKDLISVNDKVSILEKNVAAMRTIKATIWASCTILSGAIIILGVIVQIWRG